MLAILTGAATFSGLICYMLYYRFDKMASSRIGMIPLIINAFVMTVFLIMMAPPLADGIR